MKIYIAGPMTGFKHFNFPAFDNEARRYREKGYEVFNPADHDRDLLNKEHDWLPSEEDSEGPWKVWKASVTEGKLPSLRDMLGADLQWIAEEADAIHMLPGWENSRGANAEWALAKALDLKIHYST